VSRADINRPLFTKYGGPWQELRAYVATVLFGWARAAHFPATMDLARSLAAIEAEVAADKLNAAKGGKP
jgi:hypothetical protein